MVYLSLIHISEPTRRYAISYAVFCLKKKRSTNAKKTEKHAAMLEIPERDYEDCQDKLRKAKVKSDLMTMLTSPTGGGAFAAVRPKDDARVLQV